MKRIKLGMMEQEQQGRLSIQKDRYIVIWLNKYKVFKSQKQAWRFERATKHITTVYMIIEKKNNVFKSVNVCWNSPNSKDCNDGEYHIRDCVVNGEIL